MKKELIHKIKTIIDNEVIDEQEMLRLIKNEVLQAESAFVADGESSELKDLIAEKIADLRFSGGSTIIETGLGALDRFVGFLPG